MTTFKTEAHEYSKFKAGTTTPVTTRGIVVSNEDPLFAGRVKVWIPSIHGPTPYSDTGDDPSVTPIKSPGISSSQTFKNDSTISGLPWASVVSHNLGPNYDLHSNITTSAGWVSTPSTGTEVIIMFENDDPLLPIVVGSIIHANEFRYSLQRPLELLPGTLLSDILQTTIVDDKAAATPVSPQDYPSLVSSVYNIVTPAGSTLFLSDIKSNKFIVLGGSTLYGETSLLTSQEESTLSSSYPAFPTTASAAFAKRELLSGNPVSPLVAPTLANNGIGDSVSSTTIYPTQTQQPTPVTSDTVNGTTIKQALADFASAKTCTKQYPIPHIPKTMSSGQMFHAPRDNGRRLHSGIDFSVNRDGSTPLLAPIDCFPLYYGGMMFGKTSTGYKVTAGLWLLVLGIDGYAHTFMHMNNVNQNIINMCGTGKTTQLVKAGTPLGSCGITQISSESTGPHLHWEVFPAGDIETGAALHAAREAAVSSNKTINPFDWISGKISATSTTPVQNSTTNTLVLNENQVAQHFTQIASFSSNDAVNFSKPAGLEMSLVPGKEIVMLRHPSGSFIGFDVDGNILIYSCGDINFRVNRSITYDVLGGIMESAYAKFTRAKTVLANWANSWSNRAPGAVADDTMPAFFARVDNSRKADKDNAIKSTINNSLIIDSTGAVTTPSTISTSPDNTLYKALPITPLPLLNYSDTTWDTLLQKKYTTYISTIPSLAAIFSDGVKTLKAIMLYASNGISNDIDTVNSNYGLFHINAYMVQTVKNYIPTSTQLVSQFTGSVSGDSNMADANADIAIQFLVQQYYAIQKVLPGFTISNSDFRCLILFFYANQGRDMTSILTDAIQNSSPNEITYSAVEEIYSKKINVSNNYILSYVPTIDMIVKKLS